MKPFFKAVQVVVELGIQLTNTLRRIGGGCVVSIYCSFAILQAEREVIDIDKKQERTKT